MTHQDQDLQGLGTDFRKVNYRFRSAIWN